MKKKLLSFIFAICLIIPCALFVGCTKDKEPPTSEPGNEVNVLFSEDGKTLYRFAPDNDETEYTVPEGVTTISASAFENCDNLTKVVLPTTLNYVLEDAFKYCNNLTTVEINSDISIGEETFCCCTKLSTIDTSKITSYGSYAFADCGALTSVTIAKEVANLPEGVFSSMGLLSTVNFETNSNCYRIGDDAFRGSKLTSITLPASCRTIGNSAFMSTNLTNIIIGKNIKNVYSYAFAFCDDLLTVEFETGRTELLSFYGITFDESYGRTFYNCSSLTSVTNFPAESSIVSYMFEMCAKLSSFTFASEETGKLLSSTYIGDNAFNLCSSLQEIYLPEHIRDLGVFSFGSTLTKIGISNISIIDELGYDIDTLYIKTGLVTTDLTCLENFTKQTTSDKTGYDMYVRNAE